MPDDEKHIQMASKVMVEIARHLRQRQTSAEGRLWLASRNRQLGGMKFRRQYPVPNTAFVVDFYCHDAKLIVEVDGGIHAAQQENDQLRQAVLEDAGYRIARFTNDDVLSDLKSILVQILNAASRNFPLLGERDTG